MTPQERDLLSRFLDDLARSRPGPKDAEAADQIERALQGNPDAAYVLVQHAILSDQALNAAQQRIVELERQAAPGAAPQGGGEPSFLGAAFGKASPNPPTTPAGMAVPPTGSPGGYGSAPGGYPPPPADAPFGGGQPWGAGQPGPFSGGGGIGNFLRSAGTTAAGVAGGAFLFEGLSGLFGGHRGGMGFGGPGFGGQGFGGFGGGAPVENVTINDYGGGGYDGDRVDYDSDNGDFSGDDYS